MKKVMRYLINKKVITFLLEIVNVFIMKLGIWFYGKENDILKLYIY